MPAEVLASLAVSRETAIRLEAYVACLSRWQPTVNLVGAGTLAEVWTRHVLDSGQLLALCPPDARVLVDLGSGAGLPGLILAIMGVPEVHLVESDRRKAAFLREAARAAGTAVRVHACRAADAPAIAADVITARALAPLDRLLGLGRRFARPDTVWLLPKGRGYAEELTAARQAGTMEVQLHPSLSDPEGRIVRLREVAIG